MKKTMLEQMDAQEKDLNLWEARAGVGSWWNLWREKPMQDKFFGDTKLGRGADRPEGCAAMQRNLDRLEKGAVWNLMHFNKGESKVLALGKYNPSYQHKLETAQLERILSGKDLGPG
ncbi:hypothetical protein WISP_63278 [Willisornis vidua]|uniref:Uncharacterized protein n=1 Tax=Willisornis vidua TaxID=1566151 RepID=A0ABQ9DCR6_9PASS|nr:hypothetical protein WISP_63278 [Willisornis vidua]